MNFGHPEHGKIRLLAGDVLISLTAAAAAMLVHPGHHVAATQRAAAVALFALIYPACFYVFDLFDLSTLTRWRTISRLAIAGASGSFVAGFIFYFAQWLGASRGSMVIAVPVLLSASYAWRRSYPRHDRIFSNCRPVLLIGSPDRARNLASDLAARNSRYRLAALLGTDEQPPAADDISAPAMVAAMPSLPSHPSELPKRAMDRSQSRISTRLEYRVSSNAQREVLTLPGPLDAARLQELVWQRAIDTIVIQYDSVAAELAPALTRLRFHGVRIARIPDFYSQISEELPLDALSDSWLSFADGFYVVQARLYRRMKRLADILLAIIGLILSLPVSFAAVVAIKLNSPGPVLFRQWRVGWNEKPFKLLKLRSMYVDAESDGRAKWASVSDPRVTRVGRVLRDLHIDEIPQMINVLMGQMSFVGPRPERPVFVQELKTRIPFYDLRHFVPPGITGWAQVNYPYGASIEDARRKLQFDLYYIRNASLAMDLRIILRTVRSVLFRRGSR